MPFYLAKACGNKHIALPKYMSTTGRGYEPYYDPVMEICHECGQELKNCIVFTSDETNIKFHKWRSANN